MRSVILEFFAFFLSPTWRLSSSKSVVSSLDFLILHSIFVWNLKLNLLRELEPFHMLLHTAVLSSLFRRIRWGLFKLVYISSDVHWNLGDYILCLYVPDPHILVGIKKNSSPGGSFFENVCFLWKGICFLKLDKEAICTTEPRFCNLNKTRLRKIWPLCRWWVMPKWNLHLIHEKVLD